MGIIDRNRIVSMVNIIYRMVGHFAYSLRVLIGSTLVSERLLGAELAESGAVAARARVIGLRLPGQDLPLIDGSDA